MLDCRRLKSGNMWPKNPTGFPACWFSAISDIWRRKRTVSTNLSGATWAGFQRITGSIPCVAQPIWGQVVWWGKSLLFSASRLQSSKSSCGMIHQFQSMIAIPNFCTVLQVSLAIMYICYRTLLYSFLFQQRRSATSWSSRRLIKPYQIARSPFQVTASISSRGH